MTGQEGFRESGTPAQNFQFWSLDSYTVLCTSIQFIIILLIFVIIATRVSCNNDTTIPTPGGSQGAVK